MTKETNGTINLQLASLPLMSVLWNYGEQKIDCTHFEVFRVPVLQKLTDL